MEAKLLFQRALDIRTAKQGFYHKDTQVVRRALKLLETSVVTSKHGEKATKKERKPLALDSVTSRTLTKTSFKSLTIHQASTF